ncbi:MAG TPA: patatin-like phospholipase family protein [Candidatus Competibacteraceae bacterium]|nr:patatin-like phospholipase family protein [Candidatus Competibacteraceae bacterium]
MKGVTPTVRVALSLLAALALLLISACATPTRHTAVPEALQDQAVIPGLEDVRYRILKGQQTLIREGQEALKRELAYRAANGLQGPLPPAVYLAISGGGDNGAFGAGLLNGWTAAGNRPSFKLVTGISTGALTAPFAFLGPAYDAALKEVYTTISSKDILIHRGLLAPVFDDAMADNQPLWLLMRKYINQALLDAIAAEYAKGRLLLVGTTDLDAQQPIIWNMTKIAASHDPKALDLFQTILIASASIPGAFPPVLIDVEAGGHHFQEMHVDGGAMAQVFVYPAGMNVKALASAQGVERERVLYVIRNSRLDPQWAEVERKTMSIAVRAISTLIQTQGIGDLYRIYLIAQRDGVDYNLAYIPSSFNAPHQEEFDTEYMRQLVVS